VTVGELPEPPELRIERGDPSPDELAALTAVITAALATAQAAAERATDSSGASVRGRWNDPAHTLRRPWPVGPGGWRSARS
jgi:hypothetical protein